MDKRVCAVIGIGPKNGRAFASRFASEGYAVALLSRSTDYSRALAEELGGKAYACDVTDPDAIASAFAQIRADLGDVDVLLYNAGSGQFGTFDDVPDSLRGKPFTAAFAQAKAAQRSLAQSLARQLGPEGIHVAVVIVDGRIGTDDQDADANALRPTDIAETVYQVASQSKSAWTFETEVRPFNESW